MEERLLNIYNDIIADENIDQIKEYFKSRCYLINKDFGKLVSHFVEHATPEHYHILDIIFHSEKFAKENTCCDRFGEPILHVILYALAAKSDKEYWKNLLFDETIPWNWMMYSQSIENSLHIIAALCDSFGKDLTNELVDLCIKNDVCPLDRNDADTNAIEIFKYDVSDGLTEEDRNEIVLKLDEFSKTFTIEIPSATYDELVEEVTTSEAKTIVS